MLIAFTLFFLSLSVYLYISRSKLTKRIAEFQTKEDKLTNLVSKTDELSFKYKESELERVSLKSLNTLQENVIQAVSRLIEMASQFDSDETFLIKLLEEAVEIIPEADYGSVAVVEGENWKYIHTVGHDLKALQSLDLKRTFFLEPRNSTETMYFDSNVFVIEELEKKNDHFPDELYETFYKAIRKTNQTAVMEILIGENVAGTISLDTSREKKGIFSNESLKMFGALGNIAATFMAFQRLSKIQEEFQKEIILSIIRMMEIHDEYTKGHSEMVADLSREVAQALGYNSETANEVYWSGLVHDIGKILVPESILNKPSRLSASEFDIIKQHPLWGYEVLKQSKYLSQIALNVKFHHERFDGGGYPDSISGSQIPQTSRILAVADTWDAMTRNRSYRKALDIKTAIKEIEENKGTQFDPEIVDVFLPIIKNKIREGKAVD